MAVSKYDQQFLSGEDQKKIQALTDSYNQAVSQGNQSLADSYHQQAEQIRSGYEYSGGEDGTVYSYKPKDTSGNSVYQPSTLKPATSQESYIKDLYAAQQEANLNALKSAYDQNVIDLEAAKAQIPQTYQDARNQTAGQAAVNQQNFNEYAAAAGLNTGAGGQARLSMTNQLQGDLGALNRDEANALNDIETQRLRLSIQYQNDIAQAIADGNYQLAGALYQEAQRVDDSLVAIGQAQADENYRAWSSNYQLNQANREFALSQVNAMLQAGMTPPDSLIQASGLDPSYVSAMQAYYAPKYTSYSGYRGNNQASYEPANDSQQPSESNSGSNANDVRKLLLEMKASGSSGYLMDRMLEQAREENLISAGEYAVLEMELNNGLGPLRR